jgi:peptidyl-prolyl cis-trans isomerase A (cyclophilin A)/peptidyl-prolyl cis-trans isomerase B (cyclophilin B)
MRSALFVLAITLPVAGAPLPEKFRQSDTVVIETSLGDIKVRLQRDRSPETVANFLRYVDGRFYENTVFHRVIPNFMIQGGGLTADMTEKRGNPPVKNEGANGLSNQRGTLAAARTADPDSATSQFYINLKDNPFLDVQPGRPGYCVFGVVIEGMDVVDRIAGVATGSRGAHNDVPLQPVVIKAVRRMP